MKDKGLGEPDPEFCSQEGSPEARGADVTEGQSQEKSPHLKGGPGAGDMSSLARNPPVPPP